MHAVPRRIGAALIGALVVAALALTMASQARAADSVVWLTHPSLNGNGSIDALSAGTVFGHPEIFAKNKLWSTSNGVQQQRWIKHSVGNLMFTYENKGFPGKCLQVTSLISGEKLTVATCNGSVKQLWRRGFTGASTAPLENISSGKVATDVVSTSFVTQELDQGKPGQLWTEVPVS
jgi:hypothetical protein